MGDTQDRIGRALAELQREGVLEAAQRERVEQRLRAALDRRSEHSGLLVSIASGMGALLVAAGLLYWIGMNWQELGRAAKLAIVLGALAGLHGAGYWLAEQPGRYPRLGRALSGCTVVAFGGAIALIAQIYHLSAHYPNAVLLWWLLSLPLALLTRSQMIGAIVAALAVLWGQLHAQVWLEDSQTDVWRSELALHALLAVAQGALLLALAEWVRGTRYERFAPVLRLGWPVALAGVYLLGFDEHSYSIESRELQLWWPALCAGAPALLLVFALGQRAQSGGAARARLLAPASALAAALLLGLALVFAPERAFLLANALSFGGALGLVALGARIGGRFEIQLGLASFLAALLTRYVEYLWDKAEATWVFLGAGVLLLVVGWLLERQRRELLARVRPSGESEARA